MCFNEWVDFLVAFNRGEIADRNYDYQTLLQMFGVCCEHKLSNITCGKCTAAIPDYDMGAYECACDHGLRYAWQSCED